METSTSDIPVSTSNSNQSTGTGGASPGQSSDASSQTNATTQLVPISSRFFITCTALQVLNFETIATRH